MEDVWKIYKNHLKEAEEPVEILYNISLRKSVTTNQGYEWKSTGNSKSSSQIVNKGETGSFLELITTGFFRNNTLEDGIVYLLNIDFEINQSEFKIQMFIGQKNGEIIVQSENTTDTRYGVYLFVNGIADTTVSRESGGGDFWQHIKNMDEVIKEYF